MKRKGLVVAIVLIVGLTISLVVPVYVGAVFDLLNESIVLDLTKGSDAAPVKEVGESDSSSTLLLSGSAGTSDPQSLESVELVEPDDPNALPIPPTKGESVTFELDTEEFEHQEAWPIPGILWRVTGLVVTGIVTWRILRSPPNNRVPGAD